MNGSGGKRIGAKPILTCTHWEWYRMSVNEVEEGMLTKEVHSQPNPSVHRSKGIFPLTQPVLWMKELVRLDLIYIQRNTRMCRL